MTKNEINNIKNQISDLNKDIQIDYLIDYIKELEKENVELKKKIDEAEVKCIKGECPRLKTLENKQFTKAREIIKNLLILKNDHYGNTKMEWRVKVTEQAEQFIREIENE